jgi:hypothetical protein
LVHLVARNSDSAPSASTRISLFEPFTARMHPLVTEHTETYLFSRGELVSSLSIPRQVYHIGDSVQVTLRVRNSTNREIKSVQIRTERTLALRLASVSNAPNTPPPPTTRQVDASM